MEILKYKYRKIVLKYSAWWNVLSYSTTYWHYRVKKKKKKNVNTKHGAHLNCMSKSVSAEIVSYVCYK